ncbi:MAG: hypothetical protein WDN69_12260 [Aliidongia sp.]
MTIALALSLFGAVACAHAAEAPDPNLWLEDLKTPRVDAWIAAENAKTTGVLEQDSRYQTLYDQALAIAEAKDRIPTPRFLGGAVYNFWQDADHVRGLWRKTGLTDYRAPEPGWTPVLDLDALAKAENANWVWKGADCQRPEERLCLVSLSDGGEDAVTLREFDLSANGFVAGGFDLPKSKQSVAWNGSDDLLVARDWGHGTMTKAGYPFVVKSLKRGQKLAQAHEIYRGKPSDTEVDPVALSDGDGHRAVFIQRGVSFFETETYLLRDGKPVRLNLPPKARVAELVAGRLLVKLEQDWTAGGKSFAQGSLVALDLAAVTADPKNLKPTLVYAPGPRDSLDEVSATPLPLVVTSYTDVKGRPRSIPHRPMAAGASASSTCPTTARSASSTRIPVAARRS